MSSEITNEPCTCDGAVAKGIRKGDPFGGWGINGLLKAENGEEYLAEQEKRIRENIEQEQKQLQFVTKLGAAMTQYGWAKFLADYAESLREVLVKEGQK